MDKLEIIQLDPDQWSQYKHLRLRALKDNPESFGEIYDELILRPNREWQSRLELAAEEKTKWMLFAKLHSKLVGMVSGTAMESIKGVKIREMFVAKEVRGQGVAKNLMKNLISKILKTSEFRILRLGVFKDQVDAVNLYKGLGFKVVEDKTEYFAHGTSHQSLIMEKALTN